MLLRARRLAAPRSSGDRYARRQLQQRHPRPLRRRQVLPRQSSRRCGCSTRASRSSSSTPRTSTARLCARRRRRATSRSPARARSRSTRSTSQPPSDGPRRWTSGSLFLAELIELLAGRLDGGELAALDRAARAAYHAAGITADPATHRVLRRCCRPRPRARAGGETGKRARRAAQPLRDGLALLAVRPADERPARRAARLLLAARAPRADASPRAAADPRRDLALARGPAAPALRARRRGLALMRETPSARARRPAHVPVPAREEAPANAGPG